MKENKKISIANQAIGNSILDIISSFVQRIGGLIFTIIVARILMPEGFGIYGLAISIASVFMVFGKMGIDETFIRYFSEFSRNKKMASAYFKFIMKIKLIVLLVLLTIIFLSSHVLVNLVFKKPALFLPLLLCAGYMFILSIEGLFTSFFIAIRKIKYVVYKESLFQFLRIILVVIMVAIFVKNPDIINTFLSLILASIVTFLFVIFKIKAMSPNLFKKAGKLDKKDKKRIIHFFGYFTFTSISLVFFGNIDSVMIGYLIENASAIGFYKAAFTISSSIAGFLGFGMVLLPLFIQKKKKLEYVYNIVLKYLMILAIPATFGIIALASHFVVLIYDYEYIESTLPLIFLAFTIILTVYVSSVVQLFLTKEKPQGYFKLLLSVIIINIILNYILITSLLRYSIIWGVSGAAIATVLSWLIYAVGINILAKKKLGIRTKIRVMIKPFFASLVMFAVIYLIKKQYYDISLLSGFLLVITGAVIYLIIMLVIKGIVKEDILIFRDFIKNSNLI